MQRGDAPLPGVWGRLPDTRKTSLGGWVGRTIWLVHFYSSASFNRALWHWRFTATGSAVMWVG